MRDPAALIPGRAALADLQALLDATRAQTPGGRSANLPGGSKRLLPRQPAAPPENGGFRVTASASPGRVQIAPGWVHFHESWIQPAATLLVPNLSSATGKVRAVIEARATSTNALNFLYPVSPQIGLGVRYEFYTGPGLPDTNATGSTEGLKWEWYFYLASIEDGEITQFLDFIEASPRPF